MVKRLLNPVAVVALLLVVFVIPLLVAGGLYVYALGEPRRQLDAQRALWASRAPDHYRYEVSIGCMCPRELASPVLIEVENGIGRVVSYADGTPVDPVRINSWQQVRTMEGVFDIIDHWIDYRDGTMTVHYDPVNGHPTVIDIDLIPEAIDDEVRYTIRNVQIVR